MVTNIFDEFGVHVRTVSTSDVRCSEQQHHMPNLGAEQHKIVGGLADQTDVNEFRYICSKGTIGAQYKTVRMYEIKI